MWAESSRRIHSAAIIQPANPVHKQNTARCGAQRAVSVSEGRLSSTGLAADQATLTGTSVEVRMAWL